MKYLNPTTLQYETLSIKALDGMPIGSGIDYYGLNTEIPTGWLLCDGSAVSRTEYSELFAKIGTYYGSGDGSTTFNLPDMRERVGVGINPNDATERFDLIGKTGGEKTHTLIVDEIPPHSHNTVWKTGSYTTQRSALDWSGGQTAWQYQPTTDTGGGQAHNNLQPYTIVCKIIKAKNTTPTMASIVDAYSTSTQDAYSCSYVNDINTYSTNEVNTHKKWIDGKEIYRKTITITQQSQAHGINNLGDVVNISAILNNYLYGSNNVAYDVVVQDTIVWIVGRALDNVSNGIVLTVEYTKTS